MNYEQFVQELLDCTKRRLPFEGKVERHEVVKNNGVTWIGLSVRKHDEAIAPIIYLDRYYERYCKGEKIEKLSEDLLLQTAQAPQPPEWDYHSILEFEKIKDRVIYRLVSRERNEKLLKEVPHLLMMDLAIVFYVTVPSKEAEDCAVLIRNSHKGLWRVSAAELYESAKENTPKLCPYVFLTMEEQLEKMGCGKFEEMPSLWILTNVSGVGGAAVILYPKMPKKIYEKLGCGYYLLPSSIHEFLIVPDNAVGTQKNLPMIVREVNATQLAEEDVLSDNVYYFDGVDITKM